MSKPKHLFGDKVPTVEVAAKRYAATAALNLTDRYPEVEEAFMQMIREVRAAAWDEGHTAGSMSLGAAILHGSAYEEQANPYRPLGEVA